MSSLGYDARRQLLDYCARCRVVNFRGQLFAGILAVLLTVSGCATQDSRRGELRFDLGEEAAKKEIVFPPPPDTARYVYTGQLIGERNFVFEKPKERSLGSFLRWISGVDEANDVVELKRPVAVATDRLGRIFVTDMGVGGVMIFDKPAGELRVLRQADAANLFKAPTGIAVNTQGDLFVADSELAIVARFDSEGSLRAPIGAGILKRPVGVAVDPATGRIVVVDADASDIKVFDREGLLVAVHGRLGDGIGEFNRPTFVAVRNGEIYVTDTFNARIQVLDLETGEVLSSFGRRGLFVGQLVRPKGIAVDAYGNIYVIESYYDHLLVFDRKGRFLMGIGGTGYDQRSFYLPSGVAVDSTNRVFVADMFNGRIATYMFLGDEADSD